MSTVAQVMRKELKTIRHDAPIKEAAQRMKNERIGSLLVEKAGDVVGIVTDTDVVRRGVADGSDLTKIQVHTIMTSPVATIESNRTMQDAHDMMGDLSVRHLGVTEKSKLVGLVSVRDLLVYYKRVSEPKISQD
ncbi:MAG TPA: CBS domain-containing protein [Nitrospiraceae bacterium]|jgi:signal-transduction protein with cAMP-binding, CBS, and nucleotidyltransferase domain|nr:CBS domain-containing protein [Nitrospiraceae bacterium]